MQTPLSRVAAAIVRLRAYLGWPPNSAWVAAGSTGSVLAFDSFLSFLSPPVYIQALLDEPAHIATTLLFLRASSSRFPPAFVGAALLSSVLIDLDHIPIYVGPAALAPDAGRPYTHSLAGVVVFACATYLLGCPRPVMLGVAFGLASHLVRDMATGTVWLLWPLSFSRYSMPYAIYVALLLSSLGLAVLRRSRMLM